MKTIEVRLFQYDVEFTVVIFIIMIASYPGLEYITMTTKVCMPVAECGMERGEGQPW